MISGVMGFCWICNQSHEIPIYGLALEGQQFKFTVSSQYFNILIFCEYSHLENILDKFSA